MASIFDGDIVVEIPIPKTNFLSIFERRAWGMMELGAYVAKIHGKHYTSSAVDNTNQYGRLTGIQLTVHLNNKCITYAIIEPRQNLEGKILISKNETASEEAGILDVIDHQIGEGSKKLESPLAAALRSANVDKISLPERADLVTVEVNLHPTFKKPALKPVLLQKDPVVGNVTALRMFHGTPPKGSLEPGQRWVARIREIIPTTRMTNNGKGNARIVHVNVDLLELCRA